MGDSTQLLSDAVEQAVLERVKRIRVGDPMQAETNFGPLTSFPHMEKVLSYIELGKQQGATLLIGGERATSAELAQGAYVMPTVFSDCHDDMRIVQDEIFGPVMSILTYDSIEEVIQRANQTPYGLAAGVVTQDISQAHRIIHQLEAGICWVNTWGESPAEMPVGGYKQSGVGRENGISTLQHYTRMARSTPGMVSNMSAESTRSSPTAPMMVRSVPRDRCSLRPAARILATTASIGQDLS